MYDPGSTIDPSGTGLVGFVLFAAAIVLVVVVQLVAAARKAESDRGREELEVLRLLEAARGRAHSEQAVDAQAHGAPRGSVPGQQLADLAARMEADPSLFSGQRERLLGVMGSLSTAVAPSAPATSTLVVASGPLVPGPPPSGYRAWQRLSDEAAMVLLAAVHAMRSSNEGRSLEPYATPTAAEQFAAVVKAVRAFALATSPETAAGPLGVEVLSTRGLSDTEGEARVVVCTPPTQESGRAKAIVRADQIWTIELQQPVACGACGAPVVAEDRTCEYCGADIGDGEWRIVDASPTRRSRSPLAAQWPVLDNYSRRLDSAAMAFAQPETPGASAQRGN